MTLPPSGGGGLPSGTTPLLLSAADVVGADVGQGGLSTRRLTVDGDDRDAGVVAGWIAGARALTSSGEMTMALTP